VLHSHETLLAGSHNAIDDPESCALATFPAGHSAAVVGLLRLLTTGGTSVVMDRWSARRAAELIEEHRVTMCAGTPFFMRTLLDEFDSTGRDITSLRYFLCGAAAVPPALVARAEARGIMSWRTYGSTEHPAVSSGSPLDPVTKRQLTDGKVTSGNEVRILDETGQPVAAGHVGEIYTQGPRMFLGYADASADEGVLVDGWYRTGDLGFLDPDGHLVITDRVKDIVIRGGENISARQVEEILLTHPDILDVAICPAPDELWGEVVCAFVVSQQGSCIELDTIQSFAVEHGLATHAAPERLELVDELPRTTAGKVQKQVLRAQLT
jgi:non-ribosomal peptide synthetase component E (peptide arylation enzyme)